MRWNSFIKVGLWLAATAWMGAVIFFSLQPPSSGPDLFPYQDKVQHFIAYAVMAYLSGASLLKTFSNFSRPALFAAVVCWCGLYGLVLELIQSRIGRDFSLLDELANVAGAVAGVLVLRSGLIRIFHGQKQRGL